MSYDRELAVSLAVEFAEIAATTPPGRPLFPGEALAVAHLWLRASVLVGKDQLVLARAEDDLVAVVLYADRFFLTLSNQQQSLLSSPVSVMDLHHDLSPLIEHCRRPQRHQSQIAFVCLSLVSRAVEAQDAFRTKRCGPVAIRTIDIECFQMPFCDLWQDQAMLLMAEPNRRVGMMCFFEQLHSQR